jgi:hypothetical protein
MSRSFLTNVVVFGAEVVGREWKEPGRATGVPAPPPRRHRGLLISPLIKDNYYFPSATIRIPEFTTNFDGATGR